MASSGNTPLLGRGRLILPDGQISSCFTCLPVQPLLQKYFRIPLTRIKSISFAIPSHTEGRFAIVTDVGNGMRWTRQRWARDVMAGRVHRACERSNGMLTRDAETDGEVVWF